MLVVDNTVSFINGDKDSYAKKNHMTLKSEAIGSFAGGGTGICKYIQSYIDHYAGKGFDKELLTLAGDNLRNYYSALIDSIADKDRPASVHTDTFGGGNGIKYSYTDQNGNTTTKTETSASFVYKDAYDYNWLKNTTYSGSSGIYFYEAAYSYQIGLDQSKLHAKFVEFYNALI